MPFSDELNCAGLIAGYYEWLKKRTSWKMVNGAVEITTPFLNRHNDFIQLYIVKDPNGDFKLTDLGETIEDLECCGCDVSKGKRKSFLTQIVNGHGIYMDASELYVPFTAENFSEAKHSLVQAVMSIDDLFYTTKPTTGSFFFDEVSRWLSGNKVRFSPNVQFVGQSTLTHNFDFVIPKSDKKAERILKLANSPTSSSVQLTLFAWEDIRPERSEATLFYLVNDEPVKSQIAHALAKYDVKLVTWTERESFIEELAA